MIVHGFGLSLFGQKRIRPDRDTKTRKMKTSSRLDKETELEGMKFKKKSNTISHNYFTHDKRAVKKYKPKR